MRWWLQRGTPVATFSLSFRNAPGAQGGEVCPVKPKVVPMGCLSAKSLYGSLVAIPHALERSGISEPVTPE